MFKTLFKILLLILFIIIIFIIYLSTFGFKTNKFNDLIKSQIIKQDNRVNIDLEDVFVKLNIKEKSLSINTSNLNFYILKEKQEISNVDILIGLEALIQKDLNIKKIIINSKKNKIDELLKFIRTYKVSIPALYLENSISKGKIIYNINSTFKNNKLDQIELDGQIFDAELNILGREKLENINLNFNYENKNIEIINLKVKNNNLDFISKNIKIKINDDLIKVKGDIKNKLNLDLISKFINYNFNNSLDSKTLFNSQSTFDFSITKRFKLKEFDIKSKISNDELKMNFKELELNDYIKNFKNKIIFKNNDINLNINKDKIKIELNSNFALNKNNKFQNILINYSKNISEETYKIDMDLSEIHLKLEELSFDKNIKDELFLNFELVKYKNNYELNKFKLFNKENVFNLENIKFNQNRKINDFHLIKFNYLNKDGFMNDLLITKKNNIIYLNSEKFDISSNVEKSLRNSVNTNILNYFHDLNSRIKIDVKSARLDNDHNLENLIGNIIIKNNKADKINLNANFNHTNQFIYTKNDLNGKKVTTIYSDIAKPFVKKFKFIKGFEDGRLDFTSTEISDDQSKSELRIYDFKLKDMPALTKLLSLSSLQGIADLATGEGIRFNEFDMFYDSSKNLITINEIYALGPAISILMEGYVEKNKLVSLRGTLVPATTINKTIAKIPLLGSILVGDKSGEGVFGVSFKIKGPPNNLDTRVNPIKSLTPRFITRTLDKIKNAN